MEQKKFETRIEVINGKKFLFIKPEVKEIINEDGTKDIVINAPSLGLINKFISTNEI